MPNNTANGDISDSSSGAATATDALASLLQKTQNLSTFGLPLTKPIYNHNIHSHTHHQHQMMSTSDTNKENSSTTPKNSKQHGQGHGHGRNDIFIRTPTSIFSLPAPTYNV